MRNGRADEFIDVDVDDAGTVVEDADAARRLEFKCRSSADARVSEPFDK